MGITPLVMAAATVGGALISSNASSNAADTQAQAAQNASQAQIQAAQIAQQTQLGMFNQVRSDLSPYMSIGPAALQQLASIYGLPFTPPGSPAGGGVQFGGTPVQVPGGGIAMPGMGPGVTPGFTPTPMQAGGDTFGGGRPGTISAAAGGAPPPSFYGLPANTDWNAFLQNNPDIMQWAQSGHGDPNVPIEQQSLGQRAAYWYNHTQQTGGQDSRLTTPLPTLAPQTPAATTPAAPPGPGTPGGPPAMTTTANGFPVSNYALPAGLSNFANFPGYQFGMDQGVQALDRSAASRGLLLSGGQLKDVTQFGNNYAMQQAWAPYISGLTGMLNLGENAAAGVGNAGITTGQGIAGLQVGAGNAAANGFLGAGQASAAGQVGVANALSGGLQNSLLAYQMFNGGQGMMPGGGQWDYLSSNPGAMSEMAGLY